MWSFSGRSYLWSAWDCCRCALEWCTHTYNTIRTTSGSSRFFTPPSPCSPLRSRSTSWWMSVLSSGLYYRKKHSRCSTTWTPLIGEACIFAGNGWLSSQSGCARNWYFWLCLLDCQSSCRLASGLRNNCHWEIGIISCDRIRLGNSHWKGCWQTNVSATTWNFLMCANANHEKMQ